MGVEYKLFLVPTPAEFMPELSVVEELLNTLTHECWLPEFACTIDSPNCGPMKYNPIRYHSRRKSTFVRRKSIPSAVPRSFLWKLFRTEEPSAPAEVEERVPMFIDADAPFDERWLTEQFKAEGLLLQYSINEALTQQLKLPLDRLDFSFDGYYYDINFAVASDFLTVNSECLEGFESDCCEHCDRPFGTTHDDFFCRERIPLECPHCSIPFIPDHRLFRTRCPFTGEDKHVLGGPVARFMIEIDCGKCIPNSSVNVAPALRELCEHVLGCKLRQYDTAY